MKTVLLSILVSAMGAAQTDSGAWKSYGKNSFGWRYSDLTQIDTTTVRRLAPQWMYQTGVPGKNETTPLVFDRTMYHHGAVEYGLGARRFNGAASLVVQEHATPALGYLLRARESRLRCTQNKLFKVNLEGTLLALDQKSGAVLWQATLGRLQERLLCYRRSVDCEKPGRYRNGGSGVWHAWIY